MLSRFSESSLPPGKATRSCVHAARSRAGTNDEAQRRLLHVAGNLRVRAPCAEAGQPCLPCRRLASCLAALLGSHVHGFAPDDRLLVVCRDRAPRAEEDAVMLRDRIERLMESDVELREGFGDGEPEIVVAYRRMPPARLLRTSAI